MEAKNSLETYNKIYSEFVKSKLFPEDFEPLEYIKKDCLTREETRKIQDILDVYGDKCYDIEEKELKEKIYRLEYEINDDMKQIYLMEKYKKTNGLNGYYIYDKNMHNEMLENIDKNTNKLIIKYDKYHEMIQNHYPYIVSYIKHLFVCIRFNIRIHRSKLNKLIKMNYKDLYDMIKDNDAMTLYDT
jgi:hypothetical protein